MVRAAQGLELASSRCAAILHLLLSHQRIRRDAGADRLDPEHALIITELFLIQIFAELLLEEGLHFIKLRLQGRHVRGRNLPVLQVGLLQHAMV